MVGNRPITEVLVGGFLIWFTEWDSEVSGLDVWHAAAGGKKLLDLLWSGDEVQIRTFRRPAEWAPALFALAREKTGVVLH